MTSKSSSGSQDKTQDVQNEHELQARDPEERWQSIIEGLEETVLQASEEELLTESREQGRDPLKEAEEVRKILLDALKAIPPDAERGRGR